MNKPYRKLANKTLPKNRIFANLDLATFHQLFRFKFGAKTRIMVGMEKMLPASCHGLALVSIISRQFMLHLMPFWLPEFFIVWVRGWAGLGQAGLGPAGPGQDGSWWGGVKGWEGSPILWVWHLIYGFVIQEETVCGFETMMCFVVVVVAQHVLKLFLKLEYYLSLCLLCLLNQFIEEHKRGIS